MGNEGIGAAHRVGLHHEPGADEHLPHGNSPRLGLGSPQRVGGPLLIAQGAGAFNPAEFFCKATGEGLEMDGNSSFDGAVRGVLFDAGNTLIQVRDSVGAVYAAVARRSGVAADPALLDARFQAAFARRRGSFLTGVSRPHSPWREKAWWRGLVAEVFPEPEVFGPGNEGFGVFFEALYREFEKPDHWQLFPDVVPCLETLARWDIPVAVVSNWDSRLHSVLRGLGIAETLQFVLTSAEFGAEKPDPTIFREAIDRLGLAPEQVLHVGDSLEDDVHGARAAGLQAAWLRRGAPGDCPDGVACWGDLGELAGRLR